MLQLGLTPTEHHAPTNRYPAMGCVASSRNALYACSMSPWLLNVLALHIGSSFALLFQVWGMGLCWTLYVMQLLSLMVFLISKLFYYSFKNDLASAIAASLSKQLFLVLAACFNFIFTCHKIALMFSHHQRVLGADNGP